MRRRSAMFLLATSLASASPAIAADEKGLGWNLGSDLHRCDLELAPELGRPFWLAAPAALTRQVRASDFERKRRFRVDVDDLSDILWVYVLSLPDADLGAKGGTWKIADAFSTRWGDLEARGREEVKRQDGVATLKATIALRVTKGRPGTNLADGTLTIERTFDEAKGQVTAGKFDGTFSLNGKPARGAGTIVARGKVDLRSKDFLASVDAAIKRGAKELEKRLHSEVKNYKKGVKPAGAHSGYELGNVAIVTFALLRSGVDAEKLKEAFDFMATCEWKEVYSVSLYLLCLEARTIKREEVPPAEGNHTVAKFTKNPVPDPIKKEISRAAEWLLAARKRGAWSYGNPAASAGDRSNSQFAILALHSAATSGANVDPAVWAEVADELAASQEAEGPSANLKDVVWTPAAPPGLLPGVGGEPLAGGGTREKKTPPAKLFDAWARGWGYYMRTPCAAGKSYGSMTGAGISSAVIAREGLRRAKLLDADLDQKTRRAILDGVAWFSRHWTPAQNVNHGTWLYYYLYSVEKAMETAGVESLNGHDWWGEGCAQLLLLEDKQRPGLWSSNSDTSFTLLFLNRATLPARLVVEKGGKIASGAQDPNAWDQVKVEGVGFVRMQQVLEVLEGASEPGDALPIAEKGFELLAEEARPRLVPALLRLRAHAHKEVARFAVRALKNATGGLEDEAAARAFHERWDECARAAEKRDYEAIPKVRAFLAAPDATAPLKRAACSTLGRLNAVEALGDLIEALSDKDLADRKMAASVVIQIAGPVCELDPAADARARAKQQAEWRTWWERSGVALVAAEDARRAVEQLGAAGETAKKAEARVRALGKGAVRALIDGLGDPRARTKAHALLKEITKQDLPADRAAWLAWWEKNGKGS